MTGYLQRLLDAAPPASGPPPLTPVVKSTSPVFEQNQLLGLAELHAGEGDAEAVLPSAADVPGPRTASARRPIPPAAAVLRLPEMMPHDPPPLPPAPRRDAMSGRPMSVDPSPPGTATVTVTTPEPHEVPDTVIEPARPDPKTLEPALRLETAPAGPPEPATEVTPAPAPIEPVLVPAETTQVATEATSLIGTEATSQPDTEARPVAPSSVIRDAPGDARPIERADAPLLPRDLEPRPRPDFDDRDPDCTSPGPSCCARRRASPSAASPSAGPDPAPAPSRSRAPRTAATASMIGPAGQPSGAAAPVRAEPALAMSLFDLSHVTSRWPRRCGSTSSGSSRRSPALEVSTLPPERVSGEMNTVNLYLYHVAEDPHYRNLVGNLSDARPVQTKPMSLILYYILTTHHEVNSTFDTVIEQRLMGYALKTLHDYAVIDDDTEISGTQVLHTDLRGRDNRLEVTLRPVTPEDSIAFWSAEDRQTARLSAYYEVRYVLLEPDPPRRLPGVVLSLGTFIVDIASPQLAGSRSAVTFTLPAQAGGGEQTIVASPARVGPPGPPNGNRLTLLGTNLAIGQARRLYLRNARWRERVPELERVLVDPDLPQNAADGWTISRGERPDRRHARHPADAWRCRPGLPSCCRSSPASITRASRS